MTDRRLRDPVSSPVPNHYNAPGMPALPIRMPEQGDQAEWVRLRGALWPDTTPEQHEVEIENLLADADRAAAFVSPAESGDALAGFVEVALRPWAEGCASSPVAYVEGIYVTEPDRRRGVGEALLRAAEAWAIDRGCREIAADARLDNAPSRALHRRLGYSESEALVHLCKPLPEPAREEAP
jgi:aminoglycoside 6'-N-acetyltransferase I